MDRRKGQVSGKTMLFLLLLTAAGCIFVYHNYILGDQLLVFSDGGSDTKEQYIMWYDGIMNMLRSGGITAWDFHNGLGASIYNLNLFNPFLWIIYLIGTAFGPESIVHAMVYLLMAEILLAAQTCYLMLSCRAYSERAKMLASFMYAFSGYLLVWGQHYSLGGIMVLLPVLLLFIEKSMDRKINLLGVTGMMGLIILNGYYQGYMTAVGIGIYVTIRTLLYNEGEMREKWKNFASIALSMAAGLLIGMINLLPALITVQTSDRLTSEYSLFKRLLISCLPWDKEYLRTLLYRLFGTNLQGQGNYFVGYKNYYEAVQVFFSVIFIILLLQYVLTIHKREITQKQKMCHYLGIFICLFAVTIQVGSMPFNAFAYPFTRHVFLMLPFWAMLSAWSLTQIFEEEGLFSLPALIAAALLILAVYGKAYLNYKEPMYETNTLILFACAAGAVLVIGLVRRQKIDHQTAWLLLVGTVIISTAADGGLTVRYRPAVSKSDTQYFEETYQGDTTEALAWIAAQDEEWYRVEKDYYTAGAYLEAMAQTYDGVSTYNSTQTGGSLRFVDELWPQLLTGYDRSHDTFRNAVHEDVQASLTGVKYLLSLSDTAPADNYELLHQVGEVYIFRNNDVENPVQFFTNTISSEEFLQQKETLDIRNLLTEVLITDAEEEDALTAGEISSYVKQEIEGVYDAETVECDSLTLDENGPMMNFVGSGTIALDSEKLSGYDRVWAEFDIESDPSAPIKIYAGDDRAVDYLNKETVSYSLQLPEGTKELYFETLDTSETYAIHNLHIYGSENTAETADDAEKAEIHAVKSERTSTVSGTIETAEDGYVLLTIPYQKGWTVEVDEEPVEILTGDYAFMAFRVSAGSHTFKASYSIPLFGISAYITIISALLWLLGCLIYGGRLLIKRIRLEIRVRKNIRERKLRAAENMGTTEGNPITAEGQMEKELTEDDYNL